MQREVVGALDSLERRLASSRFLLGDRATECDLRLLPTIIRCVCEGAQGGRGGGSGKPAAKGSTRRRAGALRRWLPGDCSKA